MKENILADIIFFIIVNSQALLIAHFTFCFIIDQLYWEGHKDLKNFKQEADSYICSVLPDSPYHQVYFTPGISPLHPNFL